MHLVCFERIPHSPAWLLPARRDLRGTDRAGFDTVELGRPGVRRLGALLRGGPRAGDVVDLNRALAARLARGDAGAPEAEADSLLPSDPLAFLRGFERGCGAARLALDFAEEALERWAPEELLREGILQAQQEVRLCAPVPRPGKVIGVARNYGAHAAERGGSAPAEPVLFLKATTAVVGPRDAIVLPDTSQRVDYEGELAAIIGRPTRDVGEADALAHVAGYTVANDVTARDFQHVRGQHFIGKSCDSFCPLGPALVVDPDLDPQDLGLSTVLSGRPVQSARTKEMIFSVAELVAFASRLMTLEPGDVILTGTPAGVGAARRPPRWLRDGDVVEVRIESIGRLTNPVRRPGRSE
jgi:2-keto-4-pentenoate hydratase/2-oxohepta-3-ene-1,7-dioic acid hydratase in catechol pathway